ncbi:MAG: MptD family putative ECF transporter S component [Corynebacterium sp.]|uniref:MptD family putative ECF transporter S component n=1 Tax=Corynebacterium sp. TaxID=1720 RepID=UPI0026DB573E|nr:MptD family putative ECF transporter S component [Corynebacterium sp.]MDO5098313.1 MptD family putative ECF transporter S component [Corynebacterium sp.]
MSTARANSIVHPRNLVVAGVFSCVYFVVMFASGFLGVFTPAMMFVGGVIGILINSMVIMLYLAKVPCFGAFTILGAVLGLGMVVTGHVWFTVIVSIILGVIADSIAYAGKYRKAVLNSLGFAVFNLWTLAPLAPIFYNADEYFRYVAESMDSVDYAETMRNLFTPTVIIVWTCIAFVITFLAGLMGMRVLAKHFSRAGVV